LLIGLESFLLLSRKEIETTIMRVPGQMYQEQKNNKLSNLYDAQIVNKSNENLEIFLQVADNQGIIRFIDSKKKLQIPKGGKADVIFFLDMEKSKIKKMKTPLEIEVWKKGRIIETIKTNFLGYVN
jgi:hypothetical protein